MRYFILVGELMLKKPGKIQKGINKKIKSHKNKIRGYKLPLLHCDVGQKMNDN